MAFYLFHLFIPSTVAASVLTLALLMCTASYLVSISADITCWRFTFLNTRTYKFVYMGTSDGFG